MGSKRLFSRKRSSTPLLSSNPRLSDQTRVVKTQFASGLALCDDEGTYWLVKGGRRYRFYSTRAFTSWCLAPIRVASEAITGMPEAGVLGFRDGSLLSSFADGKLYLVSDSKVRHITDPDILHDYGLSILTVYEVSQDEIDIHKEGADLNARD